MDFPPNVNYNADVLAGTSGADRYRSNHRVEYNEPESTGFTCAPVLQEIWGRPWDQFALNMTHSVRPSCIRVIGSDEGITLDAVTWRVTVILGEDGRTIARIEQEVEVGLIGAKHGYGLSQYQDRK